MNEVSKGSPLSIEHLRRAENNLDRYLGIGNVSHICSRKQDPLLGCWDRQRCHLTTSFLTVFAPKLIERKIQYGELLTEEQLNSVQLMEHSTTTALFPALRRIRQYHLNPTETNGSPTFSQPHSQ